MRQMSLAVVLETSWSLYFNFLWYYFSHSSSSRVELSGPTHATRAAISQHCNHGIQTPGPYSEGGTDINYGLRYRSFGRAVSKRVPYSEGPGFKSWPGDLVSWDLSQSTSILPGKYWDRASNKAKTASLHIFSIHYSLIIKLSSDLLYKLLTSLLN